jgi:hypothetical protein
MFLKREVLIMSGEGDDDQRRQVENDAQVESRDAIHGEIADAQV